MDRTAHHDPSAPLTQGNRVNPIAFLFFLPQTPAVASATLASRAKRRDGQSALPFSLPEKWFPPIAQSSSRTFFLLPIALNTDSQSSA
jgi:hypothetical protein